VYLHNISDNRITGSALKNLRIFTSLCGQRAMPNVILATTMWDKVDEHEGGAREEELKSGLWREMVANGCKIARFRGTYESAWNIIGGRSERSDAAVLLQREVVDDQLRLNETQAGVALNKELEQLIRIRRDAARMLEEQAKKQNNGLLVQQLNERKAQIDENIDQIADQLRRLKIPLSRKVLLFFMPRRL